MNKLTSSTTAIAAALAAVSTAVLLAACGGSDGDAAVEIEDPTLAPQSVTTSTAAWFNFAKALISSDTGNALELTKLGALPVSDTEEPTAL